jgi:hypothetical protein
VTPEALAAWATWTGAVTALVALFFTGMAARAAHQQTTLQRHVHEETMSPYVWADIRPDDQQGQMFVLIVGNSGPTVAQDVTVCIEPPFEGADGGRYWSEAQSQLAQGVASLPPGRVMSWNLGVAFKVLERTDRPEHKITIDGRGPYGPLPTLTYRVRAGDIRHGRATPSGTLHGVTESIVGVSEAVTKLRDQASLLITNHGSSWASDYPLPAQGEPGENI